MNQSLRIAAYNLILQAEKDGRFKPGGTIIEPTSGNTRIGLAMIAAAKGYQLIITMPANMTKERINILKAYGATVVLTPAPTRMQGAIKKAIELQRHTPGSFVPQQFENKANPDAHRTTTAPEILEQMEGQLDVFIAASGTGGTITGTGEVLRQSLPNNETPRSKLRGILITLIIRFAHLEQSQLLSVDLFV